MSHRLLTWLWHIVRLCSENNTSDPVQSLVEMILPDLDYLSSVSCVLGSKPMSQDIVTPQREVRYQTLVENGERPAVLNCNAMYSNSSWDEQATHRQKHEGHRRRGTGSSTIFGQKPITLRILYVVS
ncbi:unnamed protein product [Fusarium graminearum]|uniref:Uncharacterized protein n=1 Tax=Gibberella zeae TaxID=5518 RepID=A0A4E9EK59_GIBZA|nr:unnamed protein product [Fusarium graminearum]CAF3645221.1 unnamed protein product [Fusarium graminearum]CAG1974286.1 unnamed protein product [Fusarium graminearum]CAG1990440.1 unnamed protein product [Fusarium graminearum]